MAQDVNSENLLDWAFMITMIGTALYVLAVFVFILGPDTEDVHEQSVVQQR